MWAKFLASVSGLAVAGNRSDSSNSPAHNMLRLLLLILAGTVIGAASSTPAMGDNLVVDSGVFTIAPTDNLSYDGEYIGYLNAGTVNQLGGTNTVLGAGGTDNLYLGAEYGSTGLYNLSGGQLTAATTEYIGYGGVGTLTQSGGTNNATAGLTLAHDLYASGTYNLNNGGLLVTPSLGGGFGTAVFNFGGGTLQASGSFTINVPVTINAGAQDDRHQRF